MLVLTRKIGEEMVIDGDIHVVILGVCGDKVRLGVQSPPCAPANRRRLAADWCDDPFPISFWGRLRSFIGAVC